MSLLLEQNSRLLARPAEPILHAMLRLTKQEQLVLCVVLSLLLVGWAVKSWRTAQPSERPVEQTGPE